MNQFQELCKLGSGSFSDVYKVIRLQDKQVYAMKKVKIGMLKEKEKQNALNEIRLLASLDNEYIVSYKDAIYSEGIQQYSQDTKTLAIIMEFAEGGDIAKMISRNQATQTRFSEQEIWKAMLQITQGLKELHDKSILHRDIKSANIFIGGGVYKLGDLNVSKIAQRGLVYTQTGTPYYASPEIWRDEPYDCKSDIWSLGCVLYEMCTLQPPFQAQDMEGLYKKIQKGVYPPIQGYSTQLIALISHMLRLNASSRPNCDQVLNSHLLNLEFGKLYITKNTKQNKLMRTIQLPKNLNNIKDILPVNRYDCDKENLYHREISGRYSVQSYKLMPIKTNNQQQYSVDMDEQSKRIYRIASVHDNIPTLPNESKARSITRRRPSSQYQNIEEESLLAEKVNSRKKLQKQMSEQYQIKNGNKKQLNNLPYLKPDLMAPLPLSKRPRKITTQIP